MAGIVSYGAYLPLHRLSRKEISACWEVPPMPGEKAVANLDEDSLTMAVAAGQDCLKSVDESSVGGLYFATTTSPYREKLAATTAASALDLPREVRSADFTDSLKSGTTALLAALDAADSGSLNSVLVTASDCRMGAATGQFEQLFGDGAAAVLVGNNGVAATVDGSYSYTHEFFDVWRSTDDDYVRSWEERFVLNKGYSTVVEEACKGLAKKMGLQPGDFSKLVLYGPDPRSHATMAGRLGFDLKTRVQDPLFANVGNTGAASALLQLVGALQEAKPGDRILLVGYGDGADAVALTVTEENEKVKEGRRGLNGNLESKRELSSYGRYLKWKQMVPLEPPRRPEQRMPAVPAIWREQKSILALYGQKCKVCGNIEYPPQRICVYCQAKDQFDDVRLSDKQATIFTFTRDNLAPSFDPPTVVTVVDFDGGGRMICEMTDRDPDVIKVGMPVEMTFRKLYKIKGLTNYFWKSRPIR